MIIVLCGVKGSGKNTIGDLLVKNHEFREDSFARPLKEMVELAYPAFTKDDLYGPSSSRERQREQYPFAATACLVCGAGRGYWQACEEKGKPVPGDEHYRFVKCSYCETIYPRYLNARIALQTLGTEWGRRLCGTTWVDGAFKRIEDVNEQRTAITDQKWVITDGRFRNEVERSRALGGIAILLTRGLKESTSNHASEAELRSMKPEEFSMVFDNANMTLVDLPIHVGRLLSATKFPKFSTKFEPW